MGNGKGQSEEFFRKIQGMGLERVKGVRIWERKLSWTWKWKKFESTGTFKYQPLESERGFKYRGWEVKEGFKYRSEMDFYS